MLQTHVNPLFWPENINKITKKATYHSEASRCGCVGLHLHGAAGGGAVGGVAAAALAAPPPNTVARWPRSEGSMSRSASAPPVTSGSQWSAVGPPGGPLLLKGKLGDNCRTSVTVSQGGQRGEH